LPYQYIMDTIAYFHDIILFNGHFYTNKENFRTVSLHNRFDVPYCPSDSNLLPNLSHVVEYDKTILFLAGFHSNMGHLFWDAMYPSWYGLFNYNETGSHIDFQWMTDDTMYKQYSNGWHQDILEKFSGNKITTPNLLSNTYNKPLKIPLLIVGIKNIGIGCVKSNLHVSRELHNHLNDPIEHFVNRIYSRYEIKRNSFINDQLPINVIYVQNKRQYHNIDKLFQQLNDTYLNKCTFQIIDWSKHNFEQQLNILNSTGILICGVGTARCNSPFLPNGAIEIQTGTHSLNHPHNINYIDYHVGTLSKYVKVMNINNYTLEECKQQLCSQDLNNYIKTAISIFPNKNIVHFDDNIPSSIINIRTSMTPNIFKSWRDSLSNDVGDLFNLIKK